MTDKQIRIAFGFEAGVGKDTAYEYLTQIQPGQKISFAGPLYEILHYSQGVCGFDQAKDRKFLQWIGTEWARSQDQDVWLKVASKKIDAVPTDQAIYITDVRFLNEFELLKSKGFLMVRLKRNLGDREHVTGSGSLKHASEVELDNPDVKWDVVIENNSTLELFHRHLDLLLSMARL